METQKIEQKPLWQHFQEDKNLYRDSFRYGKYFAIVEFRDMFGERTMRIRRLRRKKEEIFMDKSSKEIFFMKATEWAALGDVIFFSEGDHVHERQANGQVLTKHHFECVGSILSDAQKKLPLESQKKLIKRYKKV